MNLLSKVAPVEESIANMKSVLEKIDCNVVYKEMLHSLENAYSLNVCFPNACEFIYANGKGSTKEACEASALGEFIERLQTKNFFIDFYLPKRVHFQDEKVFDFEGNYLNSDLKNFYNPNGELSGEDFIDFNSDYLKKIVALPFVNAKTKEMVYFPVNILQNLYVSNGLASGNSMIEAKVQALSEIIERYVKFKIIQNGYSLPEIPDSVVAKFGKINSDLESLKKQGFKVSVLDASLDGQYPVVAISLIDKNGGIFVSFGAHPILEVALERTFTELMQGRDISALNGFEKPTFDMQEVSSEVNLESHFIDSNGKIAFSFLSNKKSFEYCNFNYYSKTIEDEYNYLCSIFEAKELDIYIREYNFLGFDSCQIVVPNFSEVYPIEDLLYNNKNRGKFLRDMVLNFKNYNPEEILQECDSFSDSVDMQELLGVVFKKNFTMLEFKVQLYLTLRDYEMVEALLEDSQNPLYKLIVELIKMEAYDFELAEHKEAIESIYSKELLKQAVAIIEQKEDLISVELSTKYEDILKLYDRVTNG